MVKKALNSLDQLEPPEAALLKRLFHINTKPNPMQTLRQLLNKYAGFADVLPFMEWPPSAFTFCLPAAPLGSFEL
jgi:hypothetical protein